MRQVWIRRRNKVIFGAVALGIALILAGVVIHYWEKHEKGKDKKCYVCGKKAYFVCTKCNRNICPSEMYQDSPILCKECFDKEDK